MMDKETYKRELVRMWDSLRDDKHKGYDDCNGVKCEECPFNKSERGCSGGGFIDVSEKIEIVEKWSESHPNIKTVTNRDKSKEIFHIDIYEDGKTYLSYYDFSSDDLEPELISVPIRLVKYKDKNYARKEEK